MGAFSDEEVDYLLTLPAVVAVSGRRRIHYSAEFRRECMRRYRAGESPAAIFEAAGLPAGLIGGKRIERCIARWRDDGESDTGGPETTEPSTPPAPRGVRGRRRARPLRDLLIAQQVRRIDELEAENARLRAELARLTAGGQAITGPRDSLVSV